MERAGDKQTASLVHVKGACIALWGLLAWTEWFLVPLAVENPGGPVPYINYIPQLLLLQFGCLVAILLGLSLDLTWRMRVLCIALPATYLLFQLWRCF